MNRNNCLVKNTLAFVAAPTLFLAEGNNAFALTFSGDLCYKIHYTQRESGPVNETFTAKFHVKPLDTSTCVVHMLASVLNDNPAFISGICRIGATNIYLNLTETQVHKVNSVDTEIMQVRLDSASLNGTIRQVSHDYNTSTHTFDEGYAAGTLTKIACQ